MKHHTKQLINRFIEQLKNDQTPDGSWGYPFETGVSTDAYMIILLRTLEINDEELILALTKRILSRQEANGAWKLFHDEGNGNISATVEAYYSLLYSGCVNKEDKRMRAAKKFILANGGIEKSHSFTKIMLAITGQYRWPSHFPMPAEIILLPLHFPINFYDLSEFARVNLAPITILATKKYVKKTKRSPTLSELYTSREDDFFGLKNNKELQKLCLAIEHGIKSLIGLPESIHALAVKRMKEYILDHIEPDGTLYNYFSATFLMIFSLLSLGHSKDDPVIVKAIHGLKAMKCTIDGHTHMQYTTGSVWNTSLISYALQRAGVSSADPVIEKANQYLLEQQHDRYGDWAIHNSEVLPGGWGFSHMNTMNPDVDDTTASLRALAKQVRKKPLFRQAWDRGIRWTLSMQNHDGGWPAFEKNVDNKLLNLLPIEGGKRLLLDPSSPDLTGRTLEFLGNYTRFPKNHYVIKRGSDWLFHHQEKDGSWYGRWGICYIYGTWAAITGLIAAGVETNSNAVQKAVKWLISIQNQDGGWGESCKSDLHDTYIPLGASNITQTAWALDALITVSDEATPEINAGISYLLKSCRKSDWPARYPVGQGMAGSFYIHYHSYQYIFPLLALTHYEKKFQK